MRSDEAWRQECEARHVFALRGINRNAALAYLQKVQDKRGEAAANQLRDAAAALWAANNRKGEQ